MRPAIWFSRHDATPGQIAQIELAGFRLVSLELGKALGSRPINSGADLADVRGDLASLARSEGAEAIFGVFPAPLQGIIAQPMGDGIPSVQCWAAWNVSRTPEGGKPTFTHYQWVMVGRLMI